MVKDLQELPKIRDALSYLFVEHCKIEQDGKSVARFDLNGKMMIPCASLSVLMLGPGTSITHRAVKTLSDNGCTIVWCGEEGVRFYAQGHGETRKANRLIHQAYAVSNNEKRLEVVKRMYNMRFKDATMEKDITIQQLRGFEGIRVREAYVKASKQYNVPWEGRTYERNNWNASNPVNRALSSANACLYGICHATIVSIGYSPGLGFMHQGKQLSFVFDIADLYKTEISIPLSFRIASEGDEEIGRRVRTEMRDLFKKCKIMNRIVSDIDYAIGYNSSNENHDTDFDEDASNPAQLWDG